jgi:PRTRC genetic system protein E
MIFQNLLSLLEGSAQVTLNLQKTDNGQITVVVMPSQAKGSPDTALSVPLALTGTAQELDESFAEILAQYIGNRKSLAEQAEATATVLKAATASSQKKAADALSPKGPKSKPQSEASVSNTEADENEVEDSATEGSADEESAVPASASGGSTPPAAAAASTVSNLWD